MAFLNDLLRGAAQIKQNIPVLRDLDIFSGDVAKTGSLRPPSFSNLYSADRNPIAYDAIYPQQQKTTTPPPTTSGGGGGYSRPGDQILASSLKKITELYNQLSTYKPAAFDEAYARTSVTAQTDQFYASKLEDFLKGINLQRTQSAESETTLLTQLNAGKERFLGGEKQKFEIAKEEALTGVVGSGRNLSGFGQRTLGQGEALQKTKIDNFLAGVGERETNIKQDTRQYGERLDLATDLEKREQERQKALDIESGVLNRRLEFNSEEDLRRSQYERDIQNKINSVKLSDPGLLSILGV